MSVTSHHLTEAGTGDMIEINPHAVKLIRATDEGTRVEFIDGSSVDVMASFSSMSQNLKSVLAVPTPTRGGGVPL